VRRLSENCPAPEVSRNRASSLGDHLRFRKRAVTSDAGNEIWLLTLSDLLLLLLISFVLLFGMILHRQGQAVAPPPVPVKPAQQTLPPVTQPSTQPLPPESVADGAPKEAAASLESDLVGMLGDDRIDQGVTVERRTRSLVVTFPERIIFASGMSELKNSVRPLLEKVSVFILDHPNLSIEIHGHTDDRPISNRRFPSNWELSADRATQVARTLVQLGTDPSRLSVRGFGEYRPLVANDSDLNRLKNRRVEIQFSLAPPDPDGIRP
jgi:chemotaxis protein MotB